MTNDAKLDKLMDALLVANDVMHITWRTNLPDQKAKAESKFVAARAAIHEHCQKVKKQ